MADTLTDRPLFTWSGEYFGFLHDGYVFDRNGKYVGWATREGAVWFRDGSFLGEIVEDNYVLRRQTMVNPIHRVPLVPPIPAVPRVPAIRRIPRIPRLGWIDPLESLWDDG
jgi:hypothetical protein